MGGPMKNTIQLESGDGEGVSTVWGGPVGWSQ